MKICFNNYLIKWEGHEKPLPELGGKQRKPPLEKSTFE